MSRHARTGNADRASALGWQNRLVRDLTVDSGGVRLAVRDFGGAGEPLVLLHGLGRTLVDWSVIGPLLAEHHRVVAFDIRGHGASDDGPWAWESAVADIDAVAHDLGLDARSVVGHSLGGMLAVMWGRAHPNAKGVVNVDGHGRRLPAEYVGIDAEDVRRRVAESDGRVKASLAALAGPLPPPVIDGLLSQQRALAARFGAPEAMFVESIKRTLATEPDGQTFLRPSPTGLGGRILADAEALDMYQLYETVSCPVLVIAGTEPDPGADPELMAAYRKGLRMDLEQLAREQSNITVKFIAGGHGLLFEQPDRLANLTMAFLDTKEHHAHA